jgi:hypothetical protein
MEFFMELHSLVKVNNCDFQLLFTEDSDKNIEVFGWDPFADSIK